MTTDTLYKIYSLQDDMKKKKMPSLVFVAFYNRMIQHRKHLIEFLKSRIEMGSVAAMSELIAESYEFIDFEEYILSNLNLSSARVASNLQAIEESYDSIKQYDVDQLIIKKINRMLIRVYEKLCNKPKVVGRNQKINCLLTYKNRINEIAKTEKEECLKKEDF